MSVCLMIDQYCDKGEELVWSYHDYPRSMQLLWDTIEAAEEDQINLGRLLIKHGKGDLLSVVIKAAETFPKKENMCINWNEELAAHGGDCTGDKDYVRFQCCSRSSDDPRGYTVACLGCIPLIDPCPRCADEKYWGVSFNENDVPEKQFVRNHRGEAFYKLYRYMEQTGDP